MMLRTCVQRLAAETDAAEPTKEGTLQLIRRKGRFVATTKRKGFWLESGSQNEVGWPQISEANAMLAGPSLAGEGTRLGCRGSYFQK